MAKWSKERIRAENLSAVMRARAEADARLDEQRSWHPRYSTSPVSATGSVDGWPYVLLLDSADGDIEQVAIDVLRGLMADWPEVHGFWAVSSSMVTLAGMCGNGVVHTHIRLPHNDPEAAALRTLFG